LFSFVFDYNYIFAGFVLLPYKRARAWCAEASIGTCASIGEWMDGQLLGMRV
jgi:hypothetical protein